MSTTAPPIAPAPQPAVAPTATPPRAKWLIPVLLAAALVGGLAIGGVAGGAVGFVLGSGGRDASMTGPAGFGPESGRPDGLPGDRATRPGEGRPLQPDAGREAPNGDSSAN